MLLMLLNKRRNLKLIRSQLLFICFLFVFYTGIHLLWGNVYSDSFFDWLKIVSFFLLMFFLIQLYSYNELKATLPTVISLLGIILASYGLIQLFQVVQTGKLSIPLSTYQVRTVFGHRNLYLQILFISFPFQVYTVFQAKNYLLKILQVVFVGITLLLLIVLSNRAVWFALFAGFGFIIILDYWFKMKKNMPSALKEGNLKILAISLIITFLLSVLFFTYFTQTSEATEHFSNIVKIETGSGKDRFELWKRTLNIIEEKPIFGCGAANWKIEILKYGNKGLVSENNITFYQRPHNDFLWIFSEYGLIGGLLYLITFLWAFVLLISQIKTAEGRSNVLFNYAVLYSLTGITIFSSFSFPHERIVHNILLSSFLAIIIVGKSKDTTLISIPKQGLLKMVFYSISAFLLLASLIFGYQRFLSESHTRMALLAKLENRYSLVIDEINKATSFFYQMDPLSTPLSWYKGLAFYQTGQTDSSVLFLQKAKQLNPYHVHILNNLATSYAKKGEIKKSVETYKEVLNIYPDFEEAALNLCAVYFKDEQTDSALAALAEINIDSHTPKYKSFIKVVLRSKIISVLEEEGELEMIAFLPDDEEWYYQQFLKYVSKKIPIKNLIFELSAFD